MSYDVGPPPGANVGQQPTSTHADRVIQMLAEASVKKDFLYRTLFGTKMLPHVVHQIEHLTLLFPVVNSVRRKTLESFYNVYLNTLISTTSIDGKTMNVLTETRVRQTLDETKHPVKKAMGGGGGGMF